MNWWLIIRAPQAVYAWQMWADGQPPDDSLVVAARVAAGFPPGHGWISDGAGWDLQLTLGDPHPDLLAAATVGTLTDLQKVDPNTVADYSAASASAAKADLINAVTAAFAALSAEDQQAVIAVAAKPQP